MAQKHKVGLRHDKLWIQFPLGKIKYLLFSFLRSGVEVKRGVESRHSSRNASRICLKIENGMTKH